MSDSCDPTDSSLPGSSVHGILQAGILEWAAICLGWIKDMFLKPMNACAQLSTLQKWCAYLQERSTYNTDPLTQELHIVTYIYPPRPQGHHLLDPIYFKYRKVPGCPLWIHGTPRAAVRVIYLGVIHHSCSSGFRCHLVQGRDWT